MKKMKLGLWQSCRQEQISEHYFLCYMEENVCYSTLNPERRKIIGAGEVQGAVKTLPIIVEEGVWYQDESPIIPKIFTKKISMAEESFPGNKQASCYTKTGNLWFCNELFVDNFQRITGINWQFNTQMVKSPTENIYKREGWKIGGLEK